MKVDKFEVRGSRLLLFGDGLALNWPIHGTALGIATDHGVHTATCGNSTVVMSEEMFEQIDSELLVFAHA